MQALSYMGYIMTQQQQQQIRSLLDISEDGRVIFSEFVNLAKELFAFKLDDAHLEANLVYALTQKDSLDMPALPRKVSTLYRYPSLYIRSIYNITLIKQC